MLSQIGTLPRAARLRTSSNILPPRQLRSYTRAPAGLAVTARTQSLKSNTRRPVPSPLGGGYGSKQKRWITMQHIRRMKEADEAWAERAKEIEAGKAKSFAQHLEERGLLHDVVGEKEVLHKLFTHKRVGMYAGVDPTAPSLHIGHMLPFMVLAWGYVWGLPVTFLLGGSTARVGDPTGRSEERAAMHPKVRKANIASMHMQLKKLGASIESYGRKHGYMRVWAWRRALTNNNTWWGNLPFTEMLRVLGQFVRLGPMLGRETVKNRMANGDGMSFAEFSYPLMQAWDWWHLFQKGVQVQVGGSDQYGNILFGMDAIKKILANNTDPTLDISVDKDIDKPIGITTPLLTTSSGQKFGKSAGNAIWLDKDMTSPFELYQFFVRTPDDVVERYLKMFTFVPLEEIANIMAKQNEDPSKRFAQHALAREFVELIHGEVEAERAALQHRQLFRPRESTAEPTPLPILPNSAGPKGPNPQSPTAGFINPQSGNKYAPQTTFANMPNAQVTLPRSLVYDQFFHKILWSAGLVASKSEGHRIVLNRGAQVGSRPDGTRMSDALEFTPIRTWPKEKVREFILDGDLLILKLGKWKFKMVQIVSDEEFEALGLTAPGWKDQE